MKTKIIELSTYNKASFWKTAQEQFDGIAPIDHLYNRLDGIYPGKWRQCFASNEAIKNWRETWADAFVEENLTPSEVKNGVHTCAREHDWPPSLAMFIKACNPSIDMQRAFYEACEQMHKRKSGSDSWSGPVIYWAAVKLGGDIFSYPYQAIKSRWNLVFDEAREDIKSGKLPNEVPEVKEALPAPGKTTLPPEKAQEIFAQMKAVINSKIVKD
jgi:hypothetical protein